MKRQKQLSNLPTEERPRPALRLPPTTGILNRRSPLSSASDYFLCIKFNSIVFYSLIQLNHASLINIYIEQINVGGFNVVSLFVIEIDDFSHAEIIGFV